MIDPSAFGGPARALPPAQLVGGVPLYVSGEDWLRLVSLNSASGVTLRLTGRFLAIGSAQVQPFSMDHTPATDRTQRSHSTALGEGWLLDLAVIVNGGTPAYGQTWVRVGFVRGGPTAGLQVSSLAYGYVTAQHYVSWPLASNVGLLEGPGALRSITGTTPAAGAEVVETVPTNARWWPLALYFQFVTSAVVANRLVQLVLDDGTNRFFRYGTATTQPASTTRRYNVYPGSTYTGVDNNSNVSYQWPQDLQLGAGYRIGTSTSAIDAGDQFSAVQYLVREWIES